MTEPEQSFPSTTWAWRRVKVSSRPQGHGTARSSAYGWRGLRRTRRDLPVRLTVTYRGGAQSYWLVEARGHHKVLAGHTALEDLMAAIHNDY